MCFDVHKLHKKSATTSHSASLWCLSLFFDSGLPMAMLGSSYFAMQLPGAMHDSSLPGVVALALEGRPHTTCPRWLPGGPGADRRHAQLVSRIWADMITLLCSGTGVPVRMIRFMQRNEGAMDVDMDARSICVQHVLCFAIHRALVDQKRCTDFGKTKQAL